MQVQQKVENCGAVRNARNNHIEWEKENGYNPNEDWSKNNNFMVSKYL